MFRDDHEAALARIAVLEAELKREREEDAAESARVARLEHELEVAKVKLRDAGVPVDRPKPAAKPTTKPTKRAVVATEPVKLNKPTSGKGAEILVAGILIAVLVVGFVLMALHHQPR
ncbi:MAG TPA: hypothetical protein VIV11_09760 [Kofleriaceae bacterium]